MGDKGTHNQNDRGVKLNDGNQQAKRKEDVKEVEEKIKMVNKLKAKHMKEPKKKEK